MALAIQESLADVSVGQVIAALAAVSAAVAIVWRPMSVFIGLSKQLKVFLEDWSGTPERVDRAGNVIEPAQPGMNARIGDLEESLTSLTTQLREVRHEVLPNHGGSMRDAVDRVERRQTETEQKLADHIEETAGLMPMLQDLHQTWAKKSSEGEKP